MLRVGAIILFLMTGFIMLLGAFYLVIVIGFDNLNPYFFSNAYNEEIATLSQEIFAMVKYLVILLNAVTVGYCFLMLLTIWKNLIKGQKWAFWVIVIMFGFMHIMLFIADAAIGNKNVILNIVWSVLALTGIVLSGYGLLNQKSIGKV